MTDQERVAGRHAAALLRFERANRAYLRDIAPGLRHPRPGGPVAG